MTEEQIVAEAKRLNVWQRHKFLVLIALTIIVALILVTISLRLYVSSGAIQLDLSRPGYKAVLEEEGTSQPDKLERFPASGVLDKQAIEDFRKQYDEQLEEATAIESFGGGVMNDDALGIDAPL